MPNTTLLPWLNPPADDAEDAEDAETPEVAETPSLAERVWPGEFNDAIENALDRLVAEKPYLAPQPPPLPERGIDQGPVGRMIGEPLPSGNEWLRRVAGVRDYLGGRYHGDPWT